MRRGWQGGLCEGRAGPPSAAHPSSDVFARIGEPNPSALRRAPTPCQTSSPGLEGQTRSKMSDETRAPPRPLATVSACLSSAGVQSPCEPGELCGGGRGQALEPVLLLREGRKRVLDEPAQLGELLLAARLPPQRQHPQRRVDPAERVLKMLLAAPRRRTRNPWLAVVAAPRLLIGAIPLVSTAVASTLGHEIGQRDGQTPTQPDPQSIPASVHAHHDMRAIDQGRLSLPLTTPTLGEMIW
jgi:hypothetical protein